jgi:hypothetical protein
MTLVMLVYIYSSVWLKPTILTLVFPSMEVCLLAVKDITSSKYSSRYSNVSCSVVVFPKGVSGDAEVK